MKPSHHLRLELRQGAGLGGPHSLKKYETRKRLQAMSPEERVTARAKGNRQFRKRKLDLSDTVDQKILKNTPERKR